MIKAEKLKTYDPKKFKPGFASTKQNGIHAIFDPSLQIFYSRTPNEIKGLEHLTVKLSRSPFPLVGELTIPGEDFETASGKIRSGEKTPNVVFNIFNTIIPNIKFKDRYDLLWRLKDKLFKDFKFIKIEPMLFMEYQEDFDSFYEDTIELGAEGACWISPDHVYQPDKRTWDWMKRVPEKSIEVTIHEILPGTVGKKYEHSMGAMMCTLTDKEGKKRNVKVGIFKGKTDAWRQEIYDSRERHIGKAITIVFKDYSKYGVPVQPRFEGFRWDI